MSAVLASALLVVSLYWIALGLSSCTGPNSFTAPLVAASAKLYALALADVPVLPAGSHLTGREGLLPQHCTLGSTDLDKHSWVACQVNWVETWVKALKLEFQDHNNISAYLGTSAVCIAVNLVRWYRLGKPNARIAVNLVR